MSLRVHSREAYIKSVILRLGAVLNNGRDARLGELGFFPPYVSQSTVVEIVKTMSTSVRGRLLQDISNSDDAASRDSLFSRILFDPTIGLTADALEVLLFDDLLPAQPGAPAHPTSVAFAVVAQFKIGQMRM